MTTPVISLDKTYQGKDQAYKFAQTFTKGITETPDTTAVGVEEKDPETGYVGVCFGETVPTLTEANFKKGCQFYDTNAVDGEMPIYVNIGDETSCNFVALQTAIESGDVTVDQVETALKTEIVQMAVRGTFAAPGFPFDVETDTEQAAALAVVDDASVQALLSVSGAEAGYTANYQLFPDTEAEDDAVYFGGAAAFGVLKFDIATAATYGADSLEWEYWNGSAWSSLTILWDTTNATPAASGVRSFMQDGHVVFSAPTDWASTTVNGQAGFWVRARVATGFDITQIPTLNSVEHSLVSAAAAFEIPYACTVGRGRFSWITESGANNDSKLILCNLTKGTASAIVTLTQALTVHEVADFALVCDAGDQLAVFGVQEDGTTEFADGDLELTVVKS